MDADQTQMDDTKSMKKGNYQREQFMSRGNRYNPFTSKVQNLKHCQGLLNSQMLWYNRKIVILSKQIGFALMPCQNSNMKLYKINLQDSTVQQIHINNKQSEPIILQQQAILIGSPENPQNIIILNIKKEMRIYELKFYSNFSEYRIDEIKLIRNDKIEKRQQLIDCQVMNKNIILFYRADSKEIKLKNIRINYDNQKNQFNYTDIEQQYCLYGIVNDILLQNNDIVVNIIQEINQWDYCTIDSSLYFFRLTLNNSPYKTIGKMYRIKIQNQNDRYLTEIQQLHFPQILCNNFKVIDYGLCRMGDNHILAVIKSLQIKDKIQQQTQKYCKLKFIPYNIKTKKWLQIITIDHSFTYKHSQSQISKTNIKYCPNNYLFILDAQNSINRIQFVNPKIDQFQVCSSCIKRINNSQTFQNNNKKSPFASNYLFFNISQQIQCPFSAIGLIADCALSLKSSQFSIKISNHMSNQKYIKIQFDGQQLSQQHYQSIICHSYKNDYTVLSIIQKMKLGALRLGQTLLYISYYAKGTPQEIVRVFLFSINGLILPHCQELYSYMAYEYKTSNNCISNKQGVQHKKFITQYLSTIFEDPDSLLRQKQCHNLFILDPNIVMNSQKQYYSQLVSTSMYFPSTQNNDRMDQQLGDIYLCKNLKTVPFLQKQGYQLTQNIEVSLASYLKYFNLSQNGFEIICVENNTLKLKKSEDGNKQMLNSAYINLLNKQIEENRAKIIENDPQRILSSSGLRAQIFICEFIKNKFNPSNQGILLYFRGRLINRYQTKLGKLFGKYFYKKRYRKNGAKNLWKYAGVINILDGLQPKMLWTDFKNNYNKLRLQSYLSSIINQQNRTVEQRVSNQIQDKPSLHKNLSKQSQNRIFQQQEGPQKHEQQIEQIQHKQEILSVNQQQQKQKIQQQQISAVKQKQVEGVYVSEENQYENIEYQQEFMRMISGRKKVKKNDQ